MIFNWKSLLLNKKCLMLDLKNEFKNIKNDNHNIKQELIMLKIDKNLDHQQIDNEQDEHNDGDESSQQALLSEKRYC